jgi:hypothetical protein
LDDDKKPDADKKLYFEDLRRQKEDYADTWLTGC